VRAIVLRDIRKSYTPKGDDWAEICLDGIALTIRENEFMTIIGPSGCGKTTLLRIMASLIPAAARII
jgi:NitT/TauT family transport system ATP-binding protein